MKDLPRINVATVIILVGEAAIVAYLSVMSWLMSGWMVGDSWAFQATDSDWLRVGVSRFAGWVVVGIVVGFGVWLLNRWLSAKGVALSARAASITGAIAGGAIVVASGIGASQFLIDRPWF